MCGIFGVVNLKENVTSKIISGLERLEYRGYDSAGIAVINNGNFYNIRKTGKINNLKLALETSPLEGAIGIGHTRWATHGMPNEKNAHPHQTDKVAVVHNGIIENFLEIRKFLESKNKKFYTDTDTEVIPNLITYFLEQSFSPLESTKKAISMLTGAFAIAVIFVDYHDYIIITRKGSPIAIGIGNEEMYIGSDSNALSFLTNKIIYLEEEDIAEISYNNYRIYDSNNNIIKRKIVIIDDNKIFTGKGNYRHFMQKEIFEQPLVIKNIIKAYINNKIDFPNFRFNIADINKITIVACGTSYYAGMVAKYLFESFARTSVEVDIASEFRYRKPVLPDNNLVILVSQSGETADTLASLRYTKKLGHQVLSLVNVKESSIARESDAFLQLLAGPEIGVASTKAFTAQITLFLVLAIYFAENKKIINSNKVQELLELLQEVPGRIAEILNRKEELKIIAKDLSLAKDIFYIGRGINYPICLEGALKLKEISYIHAEAVAAGELKHGNIALVDHNMPILVLAPMDDLFEKTLSNVQSIAARGGKIIAITCPKGADILKDIVENIFIIPKSDSFINPITYTIPLQLIAYYVAVNKGTDVDQPRNLAKSVTVE